MKELIKIKLILLVLFSANCAMAQFEPEEFSQIGYGIAVDHLPYELPMIEDDKFSQMSNSSWRSEFKHKSVKDRISLWIKDSTLFIPKFHYLFTFRVDTFSYHTGDSGYFIKDMQISYDPAAHKAYIDKNVFEFEGVHQFRLTIESIYDSITNQAVDTATTDIWENIGFKGEILVERYYLHPYHLPVDTLYHDINGNELSIYWASPSASTPNTYELEWAYVDTFGIETDSAQYDFIYNSTRILTADNQYKIHLVYDAGVLVYRLRRVRPDSVYYKYPKKSNWLPAEANQGYIKDYNSNNKLYVDHHEDNTKNWNYSITFAEKGLKKEVVNYFDGSLKRRQGVTMNNSDNFSIVDESIYDYHGREAIKVLPTPTQTDSFNFYPDFSLNSNDDPYGPDDFDSSASVTEICQTKANPMSTTRGASRYYSPDNPDKNLLENQYIPDAHGYPFAQTEYMPDGSGRIRRQGGVGIAHQLGSGHETRYLYGKPDMQELPALFGSEVGLHEHYKENAVIDPNGQASVSYIDQHGRVVATALAGGKPDSMAAVDKYKQAEWRADTLINEQVNSITEHVKVMSYSFSTLAEGTYSFRYNMHSPSYYFSCVGESPCYQCVYDLEFVIQDDCFNTIAYLKKKLGTLSDSSCSFDFNLDDASSEIELGAGMSISGDSIYGTLSQGTYKIYKRLVLNTDSLKDYFNDVILNSECVKSEVDFIAEEFEKLDTIDCLDCDTCSNELSYCDMKREGMRSDFVPGQGQYALYDTDPVTGVPTGSSDITSIFNWDAVSQKLRYAKLPNGAYKNDDGTESKIDIDGVLKYPQELHIEEFVRFYQPSWADALIQYHHPEYCYLENCENNVALSHEFDELMLSTETYDSALARGLLDPLDMQAGITTTKDPYFFDLSGTAITPQKTNMENQLNKVNDIGSATSTKIPLLDKDHDANIWQLSKAMSMCDLEKDEKLRASCYISYIESDVTNALMDTEEERDAYWRTFRGLYMANKLRIREADNALITSDSNCQQEVGSGSGTYSTKFAHFPKITDFKDFDDLAHDQTKLDDLYDDTRDSIDSQPICESQIPYWEEKLQNCPNWETYKDSIIAGFLEVCNSSRIDVNQFGVGTGSSKAASGRFANFEAVLLHHLGSSYKSLLCNADLIQWPPAQDPFASTREVDVSDCHCENVKKEILVFKDCSLSDCTPSAQGTELFEFLQKLINNNHLKYRSTTEALDTLGYSSEITSLLKPEMQNHDTADHYMLKYHSLNAASGNNSYLLNLHFFLDASWGNITETQGGEPKINITLTLDATKEWADVDSILSAVCLGNNNLGLIVKFNDNTTGTANVATDKFGENGSNLVNACKAILDANNIDSFLTYYNGKFNTSLTVAQMKPLLETCSEINGSGYVDGTTCTEQTQKKDAAYIAVINEYLRKDVNGGYRGSERALNEDFKCDSSDGKYNFMIKSDQYMLNFYPDFNNHNNVWWNKADITGTPKYKYGSTPHIRDLISSSGIGVLEYFTENPYLDPYLVGNLKFGKGPCNDNDDSIVHCIVSFGDPFDELDVSFGGIEEVDSLADYRYNSYLGRSVVTAYKLDYSTNAILDSAMLTFSTCNSCLSFGDISWVYGGGSNEGVNGSIEAFLRTTREDEKLDAFVDALDTLAKSSMFLTSGPVYFELPDSETSYPEKHYDQIASDADGLIWFKEANYPLGTPSTSDSVYIAYMGDRTTLSGDKGYQITFRQKGSDFISFNLIDTICEIFPDTQKVNEFYAQGRLNDAGYYFVLKAGRKSGSGTLIDSTTFYGWTSYFKPFDITVQDVNTQRVIVPNNLASNCNCYTCPEIKKGLDSFFQTYSSAQVNHPNYPEALTGFLNKYFGTFMAFQDYQTYFEDCMMEYYANMPVSLADIKISLDPSTACRDSIQSKLVQINDSVQNTIVYYAIRTSGSNEDWYISLDRVPAKHLNYVQTSIDDIVVSAACSSTAVKTNNFGSNKLMGVLLLKNDTGQIGCGSSLSSFLSSQQTRLGLASSISSTSYSSSTYYQFGIKNDTTDAQYHIIDTTGMTLRQQSQLIELVDSWSQYCNFAILNYNRINNPESLTFEGEEVCYTKISAEEDSCIACEELKFHFMEYQYEVGAQEGRAAISYLNTDSIESYFTRHDIKVYADWDDDDCASCGRDLLLGNGQQVAAQHMMNLLDSFLSNSSYNNSLMYSSLAVIPSSWYTDLNSSFENANFTSGSIVLPSSYSSNSFELIFREDSVNGKRHILFLNSYGELDIDSMVGVTDFTADFYPGQVTSGELYLIGPSGTLHKARISTSTVIFSSVCRIENTLLCPKGLEIPVKPSELDCKARYIPMALLNAEARYTSYIDSLWYAFKENYESYCMSNVRDTTIKAGQSQVYHYTLYYYDLAGNLVKTVPPAGVVPVNISSLAGDLNANRGAYDSARFVRAEHDLATNYRYNSLNQLIWQKTPDGGESEFWYDELGRLVASQNAKQSATGGVYSYTLYDDLGRITEVGEVSGSPLNTSTARNYESFKIWVGNGARQQITRTYYDTVVNQVVNGEFQGGQQNLRNRVSTTAYFEFDGTDYTRATHYSYDIHGNVHTLIQEFPELASFNARYKKLHYDYDLVSGQVNSVAYQSGKADQFFHRYSYDADNRLVSAETSHDSVIWDIDANYKYYKHGPLARTVLGEHMVQGTDYAYTLHGWLKAVNSNTLQADKDMGKDGNSSILVARDAFGFSLGYYNDNSGTTENDEDYTAIGNGDFLADESASPLGDDSRNLYNGNIKHMVTAVKPFMTGGASAMASIYKYDQLNRIVEMQTYSSMNFATNSWNAGSPSDDFQTKYTYDANGNILTLKRKTDQSTNKLMDDLIYTYASGTNQLLQVADSVVDGAYPNDIDNQGSNNYDYDEIGNLIKDEKEEIGEIEWNVYGKIRKITRGPTSTKPDLEFQYDASGQRILKIVKPTLFEGTWKKTYYSRDAQGNVMATYGKKHSIQSDSNAFHSINNYIYNYFGGLSTLISIGQNKFNGNSQFAGAYTQLLAEDSVHFDSLIAGYDVDSLMSWDNATAAIILDRACTHLTTAQQNDLLNVWVTNSRGNIEDAIQGSNFYNALVALMNVDNTDQILTSLGNQNPMALQQMYQMAGGAMPPPGLAAQITYIRGAWTVPQIVTQILNLFNPAEIDQMLGSLTNGLYTAGFALGNGTYDACNLFTDIVTYESNADIANVMMNYYTHKADQKDILIQEANAEYLLRICSRNDWNLFFYNSISLDYLNMATALTMVNYDVGKYLAQVQQTIGKSSFSDLLSGLSLTITQKWEVNEHFLYGSSRLGVYRSNKTLSSSTFTVTSVDSDGIITGKDMQDSFFYQLSYDSFTRVLTEKNYELVNHLGNVLATVSDRRTPISAGGTHIDYYEADVTTANLYYPFGMEMKTYQADSNGYRYGFNGKETDTETGTQDYGLRIYNPALGKFLSVDPLSDEYPWNSTYAFAENDVIRAIDLEGAEKYIVTAELMRINGKAYLFHTVKIDYQGNADDSRMFYKDISGNVVKSHKLGDVGHSATTRMILSRGYTGYYGYAGTIEQNPSGTFVQSNSNPILYEAFYKYDYNANPITFTRTGTQTTVTRNVVQIPAVVRQAPNIPINGRWNGGTAVMTAQMTAALDAFVQRLPAGTSNVNINVTVQAAGPNSPGPANGNFANAGALGNARAAAVRQYLQNNYGITTNTNVQFTPTQAPVINGQAAGQVIIVQPARQVVNFTVTQTPVQATFQINADGTQTQVGGVTVTGQSTSQTVQNAVPGTNIAWDNNGNNQVGNNAGGNTQGGNGNAGNNDNSGNNQGGAAGK